MKLIELAERSGVAPRTIRLYITRGLLPGPRRRGRAAAYGAEHLERLQEIRRLQQQGQTLHEISRLVAQGQGVCPPPPASAWTGYEAGAGVLVLVRTDASPWRSRHIRNVVARMVAELSALDKETANGSGH